MVSFAGLQEVAKWVGLPLWLRWAVPVFIDVAILAYSLAVLIHRARGEKTWASWVSLAGFTTVSVVANASHTFMLGHENQLQGWIAAGIAALAPVAVFASTEELGRLVIATAPTAPQLADPPLNEENRITGPALLPPPPVVLVEDATVKAQESVHEAAVSVEGASSSPELVETELEESPQAIEPLVHVPVIATPPRASLSIVPVVSNAQVEDVVSGWVMKQLSAGEQVTGKSLAAFLGVSERTGQKRLKELKDASPRMFEQPDLRNYAVQGNR